MECAKVWFCSNCRLKYYAVICVGVNFSVCVCVGESARVLCGSVQWVMVVELTKIYKRGGVFRGGRERERKRERTWSSRKRTKRPAKLVLSGLVLVHSSLALKRKN